MEDSQKQKQGNSFLLGVIVGVVITLLFTTKRGRVIFKEILEKGVDKLADLERVLRDSRGSDSLDEIIDEELGENDYVPTEPVSPKPNPAVKKETHAATKKVGVKEKPKEDFTVAEEEKAEVSEAEPEQEEKVIEEQLEPHPVSSKEESVSQEAVEEQTQIETKPKTGRRWFRGLRRKK